MKTSRNRFLPPLLGSIALLLAPAEGAEIAKLQNITALNDGGAWSGGAVPGAGDVMLWNSLYTTPGAAASLSQLGADLSVLGLKVTNVGGTRNVGATMVGFQNGSSANTLTIGAGGIDLSAATQSIQIQSRVLLGANQTWNIGNASTAGSPQGFNNNEDLGLNAQVAAAPFNLGGNTLTTAGAGQVTVTSGWTLSNGTLSVGNNLFVIQGGANRQTTIDSTMTLNANAGGNLRLQANSGALVCNAPVNLNGGTLTLISNSSAANTVNGNINVLAPSTIAVTSTNPPVLIHNGNLTGSAALTITNTAAAIALPLQFAGNNSGYSGTATRATRLSSATAGSAGATWSVTAPRRRTARGTLCKSRV